MSDTNLGNIFWAASQGAPAPTVEEPKASSCCGPKPAAEAAAPAEKVEKAQPATAPKQSSCCGPKPAADKAEAPKQSSCCGPKPTAETAASTQPAKKSCCG